jgi:TP901 family phage tail tape measure protein
MDVARLIVRVGANITELERGLSDASRRVREFAGQRVDMGELGRSLQRLGQGAREAGQRLALGVTAPLMGLGAAAVKIAADFEQTMDILQATSGATAEQMGKLDQLARELGSDLTLPGTSAKDAAEAMLELSKGGLTLADTMAATKGVLQMSAAAQVSNARAAEITVNALSAFRLAGSEATRVADLLAAAANSSSAEIAHIADGLQMSASVFAMAGVPIEDLVNALSLMANAGIKGSDAGTSLKQMLLSLQAPTDKAAKLMAAIGVSIYDAQGKMLPLRSIIEQFTQALGGMSQQQQAAALSAIFGSDAIRAANVVLAEGTAAWDKQMAAVTEAGVAAELAGAQNKGLKGALDALQSSLETVALSLTPYLDRLSEWVRALAEVTEKLSELSPATRDALLALGLVAAAAGPVLMAFGGLTQGIGGLIAAWPAVAAGAKMVATVLTGPLGLAIAAAVAAVIGLAVAWKQNWGGIRDVVGATVEWMRSHLQQTWRQIEGPARQLWFNLKVIVAAGADILRRLFRGCGDDLALILRGAFHIIQGVVKVAVGVVTGIINTAMALLTGDWKVAWESVKRAVKLAWDGIVDVVTGAIQVVIGIIRGFGRTLYNLGREAWHGFLSGFRQGAPEAEKAGRELGKAAHRGAKAALEAHSPSRAMRRLGKAAGAGLKAGLDESGSLASAAGRILAARSVEAAKGRLKEGASEIKREAKALAEELAKEMAAIRLLRAGKPPEVARAREQYPRQPMARVGELVVAQAERGRYEELFQAIRQAKKELADLDRQLAGVSKQDVIRQVFAGLSPALVERLVQLTGQTEAARARVAAMAEEQQRARQVADAYAGSIGDLSDRINEHLVALGKLSEVEALTARLARQGWTREQIQDYANLQRIEETVRLAAEARADAERKAQEAARQAAQEAADRMRRYADALAQVRAEIAALRGDPMPKLRLEMPGVDDARLRELLALRQERARLEEQIAARARAETEARRGANREEEKSAKITRRLREELADAQAAYDRARAAGDPYREVLARLNLATRDLTEEQRGLAQQIADTIVQADAVQRARRAWSEFAGRLADTFRSALSDMARGSKSFFAALRDGLLGTLQQMAIDILASQFYRLLMRGLGGLFGRGGGLGEILAGAFGGARALGGPVEPGRAYLVGERGPELFVPRSAGAIAPAGVTVQMTVVTQDAESFRRSQGQIMTDIWRQARLAAARTG